MEPVSVILTVRDEPWARLRRMFDSIADQQGCSGLELLVAVPADQLDQVGWMSPTGAVDAVRLIENPSGSRSEGLNLAAAAAENDVVCRVDSRSVLPPDYVVRCVEALRDDGTIGVVGGVQCPFAGATTAMGSGIARALSNPWAMGGAPYRRGGRSGPVDTVYLGAFRRRQLLELGGYDERLMANEDFELCQRYLEAGFLVWLDAELLVAYEARSSLGSIFGQYLVFGRAKVCYWRISGRRPNRRQLALFGLAAVAATSTACLIARPSKLSATVVAGEVSALAVADLIGGGKPPALTVPIVSCATYACTTMGWLLGVVVEGLSALRPRGMRNGALVQAVQGGQGMR